MEQLYFINRSFYMYSLFILFDYHSTDTTNGNSIVLKFLRYIFSCRYEILHQLSLQVHSNSGIICFNTSKMCLFSSNQDRMLTRMGFSDITVNHSKRFLFFYQKILLILALCPIVLILSAFPVQGYRCDFYENFLLNNFVVLDLQVHTTNI